MIIREFKPTDRESVKRCIIELQNFERTIEPTRARGEDIADRYYDSLLEKMKTKEGKLFVAEEAGQVFGFGFVWIEHDEKIYMNSLNDYAYVSDLIVRPEFRSKGAGKQILDACEAYAKQKGQKKMLLIVLADSKRVRKFYENAGYRDYEVTFLKDLA